MRQFSVAELKKMYQDAWWAGVPVEIEDVLMPYLSEAENEKLQTELAAWVCARDESQQKLEAETNWEAMWEKIEPHIPLAATNTKRLSFRQRVRRWRAKGKAMVADEIQAVFENYILDFSQGQEAVAGSQVPFELPSPLSENVRVTISFIRSEEDAIRGRLYLHFALSEDRDPKAFDRIRLVLCDAKGNPVSPRKQVKIRDQMAAFLDVDLCQHYKIRVA